METEKLKTISDLSHLLNLLDVKLNKKYIFTGDFNFFFNE